MYKLIIEDDEGKTTVVPLIRDEITIGRKEGNTIRLTERNVSRRHARLSKSNGTVYIEDLQSFNGIRVNGDRIAGRAPVSDGDRIQIGDYQLALKLDKSAPPPEEAAGPPSLPFTRDEQARNVPPEPPTRPNQTLNIASPPPEPAAAAAPERPAKLVVVSSNLAGTEFKLEKPQCVIGRTDENDVVINHRSISRHHAKIVREMGRYQVVDLGSANGVRVNGEDYGKVELRKGDLIDLGHVRLRFVAPGEDFVFSRDAQVVDVAGGDRKRPVLAITAAALLLIVGVGAIVALRGKGGEVKPGTGGSGQAAPLLQEVDRAIASERWDDAIAAAGKGLAADPSSAPLREKKARAESEKKSQGIFDQYSRAARTGESNGAVTHYLELELFKESIYLQRAQESWPAVKSAYVKGHITRARELAASGHCDEAKKLIEAVLLVDDGNASAVDLANRCGQASPAPRAQRPAAPRADRPATARPERPAPAAAPAPTPEPVSPVVPRPTPPRPAAAPAPASAPAAAASPAASPAAGAVLTDAQDCYVHGDYQCAIDKARKALKEDPGSVRAWKLMGASSCFLKDKTGASNAWNKLGKNSDRQFLNYVCQRNNIQLP